MPNPKRKHTRSRRDLRRSQNSKLEPVALVSCSNCGAARKPHNICPSCGFYKDKVVVAVAKKENSQDAK
ncbi:Ribosomal protein L32 [Elusimicrobium minutum Pei191]|uniref:Large ribosomal subunit protein bL32 n=1 Tax=Elusimicrobium minutum (strain Pei191) TaxID=445932 RepID=B2KC85_ELUMP|nr:50S ribosomal protein L32 [Elusimicrobium minutum]ACC98212.1 Ribosomal protein L32 [Elusimicrobium minutum Pei191]